MFLDVLGASGEELRGNVLAFENGARLLFVLAADVGVGSAEAVDSLVVTEKVLLYGGTEWAFMRGDGQQRLIA